jgi:hypothetical protein
MTKSWMAGPRPAMTVDWRRFCLLSQPKQDKRKQIGGGSEYSELDERPVDSRRLAISSQCFSQFFFSQFFFKFIDGRVQLLRGPPHPPIQHQPPGYDETQNAEANPGEHIHL